MSGKGFKNPVIAVCAITKNIRRLVIYRKTFDVLAKYVSQANKVQVIFDNKNGGAHADMKNDVLHLPKDIANENALGAIALLMHESAHIKHSKLIPIKELAPMQSDFHILNALEDVRIDQKNFNILPNVFQFYEQLVAKHMDLTKAKELEFDVPESARRLCAGILYAEGFNPKVSDDDRKWLATSKLINIMHRGVTELKNKDWKEVKKTIQEIKKLLKIDPKQDKPNKAQTMTGDPDGDPQQGQGGQAVEIKGQITGVAKGKGKDSAKGQDNPNDLSATGKILRPSSVWGSGKRMEGGSSMATSPLAMDEQCANQFKEILNVKETKIIEEGSILDSDNLISLYTGDVNTLFKQERTVRKKKSKVMFLMDCSASMSQSMMDGKARYEVVKSCVQKLTQIMDEVVELEGLNVDWCVSQFDTSYTPMTKEGWQRQYCPAGGTSLISGFDGAYKEMVDDYTIEGKRIIVAFSDGDIGSNEIDYVNGLIHKNSADVRAMIIGVDSQMTGKFVTDIVGDLVIISQENATEIVMEAIKSML